MLHAMHIRLLIALVALADWYRARRAWALVPSMRVAFPVSVP